MKRFIPNTITCCNLISGAVATFFAFNNDYKIALIFIIIGAVFDFFDGFAARLLKVSSPIGKELDSLADDITFGLAPSAVVFSLMGEMPMPFEWIKYASFLIAAFSALRLAKFNLDERQTTSFIGLPTPANALFWASLAIVLQNFNLQLTYLWAIFLLLIILSCWIMVSEVPMFALKFKTFSWNDNKLKFIFILSCLALILLFLFIGKINGCDVRFAPIPLIIVWYIILSCITQKK